MTISVNHRVTISGELTVETDQFDALMEAINELHKVMPVEVEVNSILTGIELGEPTSREPVDSSMTRTEVWLRQNYYTRNFSDAELNSICSRAIDEPIRHSQILLIAELGLSLRAANLLSRIGVQTIPDLMHFSEAELRRMYGVGPKMVEEIKSNLARMGHKLYEPTN